MGKRMDLRSFVLYKGDTHTFWGILGENIGKSWLSFRAIMRSKKCAVSWPFKHQKPFKDGMINWCLI